ncbi:hypothetical protein VPNG_04605 [Cytospora leucostoma]|uniref:F-box domain-containing protein n=1 Tax=Cytospora leucostoma TaxID=1230097 RepID=A0A423XCL8_9PEZI|nr:hypothetical protein VPNG_04605 [Cytospora leucostoma]
MAQLTSLPNEIKDYIINCVIQTSPETAALCASVCRDWQFLVERRAFRHLNFDQSDLENVRRILTPTRQAYICQVYFVALLPEYDANHRIYKEETTEEQRANDCAFTDAIIGLFETLAGWDLDVSANRATGVKLILGASSPSDSGTDVAPYRRLRNTWRDSVLELNLAQDTQPDYELPRLPMITSFIYGGGRNTAPSACCYIAAKMPNLRDINWGFDDYDAWETSPTRRKQLRLEFARGLADLPESLRSFALQFSHRSLENHAVDPPVLVEGPISTSLDPLSEALRSLSLRLETFILELGVVMGEDLFWPKEGEECTWPCLEEIEVNLSCTSPSGEWLYRHDPKQPPPPPPRSMLPDRRYYTRSHPVPEQVSRYFLAAAHAAAHMPRLRHLRMEFHGYPECGLDFEVPGDDMLGSAEVYVWGTTELELTTEMRDAWRAAGSAQGRRVEFVSGLDDERVSRFQCDCQPFRDNEVGGWAPLKPIGFMPPGSSLIDAIGFDL